MHKQLNILLLGVNYIGQMASTQRVKNLFEPMLKLQNISVSNLIINESVISVIQVEKGNVNYNHLSYNYKNPISVIYFLYSGLKFIFNGYNKGASNILYHYGYPSIEDIIFLKFSKLLGYKVVYDIVECAEYANISKSSLRFKFKSWTSRKMFAQLYKNGSLCIGISTQLVNYLENKCKGRVKVIFVPICIDVEKINSFKIKREENLGKIKIFYGGSFGFKDGFEFLLKGFEQACENNSNLELTLTGKISKQMDGKVQSLITASKWKDRIRFLGCLSEIDFYSTMVNSDILCMTRVNSAYANYGFPFKLSEYLASGNAVIATKVGDIEQYLIDNENSLVIKPEAANEICDSILKLARDEDLRLKLGSTGYNVALTYFSSIKVSRNLYNSLIEL